MRDERHEQYRAFNLFRSKNKTESREFTSLRTLSGMRGSRSAAHGAAFFFPFFVYLVSNILAA